MKAQIFSRMYLLFAVVFVFSACLHTPSTPSGNEGTDSTNPPIVSKTDFENDTEDLTEIDPAILGITLKLLGNSSYAEMRDAKVDDFDLGFTETIQDTSLSPVYYYYPVIADANDYNQLDSNMSIRFYTAEGAFLERDTTAKFQDAPTSRFNLTNKDKLKTGKKTQAYMFFTDKSGNSAYTKLPAFILAAPSTTP